jgi:hypothetical protein
LGSQFARFSWTKKKTSAILDRVTPLAAVDSERIVTVRGSGDHHDLVFVKRNVVSRERFFGGIMSNDFFSDFGAGSWEVS